MVVIKNELGEFVADTEKAALAAARKAKREYEKREAGRAARIGVARKEAESFGFTLLKKKVTGGRLVGEFVAPGARSAEWAFTFGKDTDHEGRPYSVTTPVRGMAEGGAQISFYGNEFLGVVQGCSGHTLAYFVRDRTTNEVECFAVGGHEDVWCGVHVPTLTPDDFPRQA